jgi:hypothetical protein
MPVNLLSAGGGTTTLAPASSASNFTVTIPSATGTMALTSQIPSAVGKVLQVLSAVKTADQTTSSTSYVDVTDLSLSITPSSASSKILVMVCINNISNSASDLTLFNIVRGSTTLTSNTSGGLADSSDAWASGGGGGMSNQDRKISSCSLNYLDSPSSTSSLTYKVQMKASGNTASINRWMLNTDNASVSSITVMEIAA